MQFLFKPRPKTPRELVKGTRDAVLRLELLRLEREADKKKLHEEIVKNLSAMRNILTGTPNASSSSSGSGSSGGIGGGSGGDHVTDAAVLAEQQHQLIQEAIAMDLLPLLIVNLSRLDLELRKDVVGVFSAMLRRKMSSVEYVANYRDHSIINGLILGYENQLIATNCGSMLRECAKHEQLARIALYSPHFYRFFDYMELPTFDVSSDAYTTFRELLTRHKRMAAEFLQQNYDKFFTTHYSRLLAPESSYLTKRQSLKLLGEILLERESYAIMMRYIGVVDNLKTTMTLLGSKSKNIPFEAFHVFKIFVANPDKTPEVLDILRRNKAKLLAFLKDFQNARDENEMFADEKAFLIKNIEQL
ncbi:Mo25-like protein [Ramicandelaber brevisporus]|nr:Mo25-like protein [Ramicandelaber brevisporus]